MWKSAGFASLWHACRLNDSTTRRCSRYAAILPQDHKILFCPTRKAASQKGAILLLLK